MRITHQNYLLVEYSQLDWDKFYVGYEVEIKVDDNISKGEITEINDNYYIELWDESNVVGRYKDIRLDTIESIRKVEK